MSQYSTSVPMVVTRQFGDEIVAANYETGVYYSLTGIGADIWLGLDAGATVDEIIAGLSKKHVAEAATIPRAVQRFVEDLLAEGIIGRSTAGKAERQPWTPIVVQFTPPVIERFEDLRELLLLDPVHDVGEAGWPIRAE